MKPRVLPALVLAACGTLVAVEGEIPDTETPAQIVLESTGGIAALRIRLHLDSGSATLARETCRLSDSPSQCGLRGSRETFTIARAEVSRLFSYTLTAEFRALRADYGSSTQASDLMGHSLSITANGRTRRILADAMTRPEPMASFMTELSRLASP
jgi:hypothetical protein